ncbi:TonB-dependent receptor [Alteriqipengyuania lutimaris]|uniref:TonB-dependent siderophore receptor n=1 Tax=Alteriqipengyuania lutimaris TaxID=1538146 RepID=A0A395LHZ9_9SPHN|nr:iron complex outermembrane receptor protein [Alteriqipengyuania lutimaris]RDS76291.1 TonB-dependent siderophore receptor [Alteriqipengyuania lutimaris]
MKFARKHLPAFVIAAAIATPALAQDEMPETGATPAEDNQIIVTAQRENASAVINGGSAGVLGDKPAEDLPFAVRTYDESLILNQQPLSLGEVLQNDPTIRTSYAFGNAAELFVIRGFPLYSDDIGLNGLYGITPRQLVAPELLGSVEVLNGASAFLNGAAPGGTGLGGSVNLRLKRADEDLTRVTAGYREASRFGGSVDVARRFGSGGEFGVRINGAYRDGETAVDGEDRRTQVIGASFDYDGGNLRAALDLAYQDIRVDNLRPKVTIASAAVPAVPDADANYAQDYTYSDLTELFGFASLEYDVAPNATLYAKAGAREGDEEGIYGGIQVTDAATGDATSGFHSYIPFEASNQAVEAGLRVQLGSTITQEINFGGNIAWQEDRTAYDFFSTFATNLYAPVQVAPQPTAFAGGDLDDPYPIATRRLMSAFASDTFGFWDDRVLLTGGLRLQSIRQRDFSYFGGALETEYDEDKVTPVVGLVVKPVDGLSLYANRIAALQVGPSAPLDPLLVTNPGETLSPRSSTQYEVGGKLDLGGLFATLAAYRIERPGEGVLPSGEFGYLGEQRHQGVEFTLNGEVTPGLRLISGMAYTDAELDGGASVAGVPEFTANADVEWDVPFASGITLTGRVVHSGEQFVDAANTLEIDSWTVFDLGARYVFAAGDTPVTLRVAVENVGNEAYWASAFDTFSNALLQGRPRTVRASISADF